MGSGDYVVDCGLEPSALRARSAFFTPPGRVVLKKGPGYLTDNGFEVPGEEE